MWVRIEESIAKGGSRVGKQRYSASDEVKRTRDEQHAVTSTGAIKNQPLVSYPNFILPKRTSCTFLCTSLTLTHNRNVGNM